jgi:hypothetical protein
MKCINYHPIGGFNMTKSIECEVNAVATSELERAVAKDLRKKDQRIEDTIHANKIGSDRSSDSDKPEEAETVGTGEDQGKS